MGAYEYSADINYGSTQNPAQYARIKFTHDGAQRMTNHMVKIAMAEIADAHDLKQDAIIDIADKFMMTAREARSYMNRVGEIGGAGDILPYTSDHDYKLTLADIADDLGLPDWRLLVVSRDTREAMTVASLRAYARSIKRQRTIRTLPMPSKTNATYRTRAFAPYNTRADYLRAVRRMARWQRHYMALLQRAPGHIQRKAWFARAMREVVERHPKEIGRLIHAEAVK